MEKNQANIDKITADHHKSGLSSNTIVLNAWICHINVFKQLHVDTNTLAIQGVMDSPSVI